MPIRTGTTMTTVDAVLGADTMDAQPESVKQAAVADRMVITKSDLTDAATLDVARVTGVKKGRILERCAPARRETRRPFLRVTA